MSLRHRATVACTPLPWKFAILLTGFAMLAPVRCQRPCNVEDEYLNGASNFEYVYNASVEVVHTSNGRTSTAGFSFSCAVIINGEEPCFYSLKFSTCRLDDRTHSRAGGGTHHSFNRLLKRRHLQFGLSEGELGPLLADPEETAFITNVRRGVLNMLRVSRPLLDTVGKVEVGQCEWTVSRQSETRRHVQRSRGCDTGRDVPNARTFFSLLPSLDWVEDRFSISSSCDYEVSRDRIQSAECLQTWQLSQPTEDDVQVVVTQELGRLRERDVDPPLARNTLEVPAGLVMEDVDRYLDVDGASVQSRLRELVSVSTPMMTPETPQKMTALLRALRGRYQNPLDMARNCTDCTAMEKSVMSELAVAAVLQCGSAPCLQQLADMLRQQQLTAAQLTPFLLTWHWYRIEDVDTAHRMYGLCQLAPTRWCLLGLATALRHSSGGSGRPDLRPIAERLRRLATGLAGRQCRGDDAAVLLALKTFSNMGRLALGDVAVLNLVRTCMLDVSRPVMLSAEAVRTLADTQLPPKFAKHFHTVVEDDQYPLLTRQLAYLALLRRFPRERTLRVLLSWAQQARSDPLSGFVLRHWKRWPVSSPLRPMVQRVSAAAGLDLSAVADDPFNSPSVSSLREFRLDRWLQMALPSVASPAAGASVYRLHGGSFVPHLVRLDTMVSLGDGRRTPLRLELSAVGLEPFIHELVRREPLDRSTVRGMLQEVASAVLAAFGARFGGVSFVRESEPEPDTLRLSPAVASWLRRLLEMYQERLAQAEVRPRALVTLMLMDSQVAYLTADDLISRLQTPEPPAEPYHVLGEKIFHAQTLFKFVENQHRMALSVGLPLEVFADGNIAANAAAEVSSRLDDSYRHMREQFNGDAQLSASAGVSLVMGLEVALPPFARAGLQLNTTVYTPFSLNVSYAIVNRTVHLTAPKPERRRTLLLLRHGAQLQQGGELRPSPAAELVSRKCVQQAVYTGLLVCRQLRHSGRTSLTAPVSYHVTGENPDSRFDRYGLDVWTTSRQDGYIHGGLLHVVLHQPAAAAHAVRLRVGFRLMPINFNPLIFRSGQRANTTLDLVVGDPEKPVWHVHALHAHEERGQVLFTESRGWLMSGGFTLARADLEREDWLPWVASTDRDLTSRLKLDVVYIGKRLTYRRQYRAAGRPGADLDFSAQLRYRTNHSSGGSASATVYRNSPLERFLAPEFFQTDPAGSEAWLAVNYSRRLTTNDQLTELNWNHEATAATASVTLTGLFNLTSTADRRTLLTANLTSSDTESGRALMYTDATADYQRHRQGADVWDSVDAALSSPSAEYRSRLRLDWPADGRLLVNGSAQRAAGWRGDVTAALEPAGAGRRLSARLRLPGDEQATLEAEFTAPRRPRPWLLWYLDDYDFSQTSRLWWSRYNVELTSGLQLHNSSESLHVDARLSLAHSQQPPAASGAVGLRWHKETALWNSSVVLDTPVIVFNNDITSREVGDVGMERQCHQSASSKYFYLLDHQLHAAITTDCHKCFQRQRDFNMKLEHKWAQLHTTSRRNISASSGHLQKLTVKLHSVADFLPSMQCSLRPSGDFSMSLSLPSMSARPELDIKYTKTKARSSRRIQVVTRAMDISIRPDPRARPVPALHVSVETTPGDPSRLAAEVQVQPSLWLATAAGLAQKLQVTAATARQTVMSRLADRQHWLNVQLRRLTGAETLLQLLPQIPHKMRQAGSWLVDRVAALLSPWWSVTAPVYKTVMQLTGAASQLVSRATASLRHSAHELYTARVAEMSRGPSLRERAVAALPRQLLGWLAQQLQQLQQQAWQRLPFKMQMSVTPAGRQRIELTELPDYANVETVWNLSAVVREKLRQPSVVSELLATPDDRRPLAAIWADGRSLGLSGHSSMLPRVDGCRHLLLADIAQRGFAVVRSGRHLVMTFHDCNVIINDRGEAHVERFNVSLPEQMRTTVEAGPARLTVVSASGLTVEADLACHVTLFRLDAWMAPRTVGLLAGADRAGWSAADLWTRFRLDDDCGDLSAAAGPELQIDACGRLPTAECTRLKGLQTRGRQHQPLCEQPSELAGVQLTVAAAEQRPAPVQVLLAVADPAVPAAAVRRLTDALHAHVSQLGQRTVQYALVAEGTDTSVSWVDDASVLQLEGHKLPTSGLLEKLHAVMTARPFAGRPTHRILVVFAATDTLAGGPHVTGLRRQLWSRRVQLQLVTPLQQRWQLPVPLHGLTAAGRVVTDSWRHSLAVPPHQGDLGRLVEASSGVVWDSALFLSETGGATSVDLMADAVWQRVTATEPGPPLPGTGAPPSVAAMVGGGAWTPSPPLLLVLLLLPLTLPL